MPGSILVSASSPNQVCMTSRASVERSTWRSTRSSHTTRSKRPPRKAESNPKAENVDSFSAWSTPGWATTKSPRRQMSRSAGRKDPKSCIRVASAPSAVIRIMSVRRIRATYWAA